jgi:hypothetical protein
MLQMTFGIDERDVRFVLQKHWDMAVNPHQRSLEAMTLAAWHSMGEEERDRIATVAMDAYLDSCNELDAAREELRKYLIEQNFLKAARRPAPEALNYQHLHARGRTPERRHVARHR